MFIGITGIPGSGKSTFLSFFKEKKIPVFNSDEIVKKLYTKKFILNKIKKEFPKFFKNEKFIKEGFSEFIFSSKKNLRKLEGILHPEVLKSLLKFKEENKGKIAVAEVPLLFEKNLEDLFDITICISIDPKKAIKNFLKSKNINLKEAKKRLTFQMDLKLKKKKANYVIENDGTIDDLKEKFIIFLNEIQKKYL